ncbi:MULTISPECIES: type IV secretion system protein [Haematobacter]|nr:MULTISPECIES: type IV secretion system protein [Haematobacter]
MTGASAQGVPTEDLRAIANAIQQLDQMKQQLQAMTGSRGISNLLNSVTDKETREAAESLSSIMDGAIGGSPIGGNASVLTDKIDDLKETFALPNLDQFLGSDLPQDRAIATQAGAGMVAMATAEDTYTRSNAAMGRVNTLIDRIDSNADMKASVDFNSRMLAEVAVLLNENLRVQAAIANTMGSDALTAARDRASQRNFLQGSNEGQ